MRDGDEWLDELLPYLAANRDFMLEYLAEHMPYIRSTKPQATYLAWLDCSSAPIDGNPHEFFLKRAKVALNDGEPFGPGGKGFVRLNFACPRATLAEAMDRMRDALAETS
jgi:cystathionine beta-lyase